MLCARQNTQGTSRKVKLTEALIKRAEPLPPQRPGEPPRKLLLLDYPGRSLGAAPVDVEVEGSLRTNDCHGEVPAGKVSRRLDAA